MREFGHKVPLRGDNGELTGLQERPAVRVTRNGLSGGYGPDSGRKLVVSLMDGDLIVFRPKGTRQRKAVSAFDLYSYVHRVEVAALARAKREAAKERRAARRRA